MSYSCVQSPVIGNEYACIKALRVDRKRGDCSKAQRSNPQKATCVCLRLPLEVIYSETMECKVDMWPTLGAVQVLRKGFSMEFDPHTPPRNANNVEPYTVVTLFSGKADSSHPHGVA